MGNKKCSVCNREMKEWGDENLGHHLHLIATKSMIDGNVHIHGDLENKDAMKELIHMSEVEIGIERKLEQGASVPKEIVFKNRQRIGDMLMFTCGVRDFKKAFPDTRVNVISTAGHIWDHNPHIDRTLQPTAENTVEIGPGKLTNKSNSLDWHMANSFRVSIEDKLKVRIEQGESRPDIWLTKEEWDSPRPIERPYWVICTNGEKGWGCKMYPHNKWQEVIDQNPEITFVQIGTAEDNAPRLAGANVIDYIGKTQNRETGIRDLFKLFLHAEGSIGLVSFHMHLSGALYKPCVVIAGGREPVSFTRYAGHQYLSNDGCLPCSVRACWHCNIDACTNLIIREETLEKKIPKCADIIESEDVTRAIKAYYKGGRLRLDVPCEKPVRLFKNIVNTPIVRPEDKKENAPENKGLNTYGMTFGGGSLTERDWVFITETIKKHKVKTVLEFGAGLSTLLLQDYGMKVVTYETKQGWIDKIKGLNPNCEIRLWDGVNFSIENKDKQKPLYHMAFVDGPAGDMARAVSTEVASMFANIVIIHDAGREWARKYQEQYLKPYFDGPFKGGHRCHLWVLKSKQPEAQKHVGACYLSEERMKNKRAEDCIELESEADKKEINNQFNGTALKSKSIKIISTARGWGGCARSITTIMKFLLAQGHKVEFIPFRNAVASREFQEMLNGELKDVKVSLGYGTIHEACDVLLVYADDYVWEFKTEAMAEVFSDINAEKKIMMLNYRRGEVGKISWTRGWDQYMFLCSAQEKELLAVYPEAAGRTKILPPCTILEPFLAMNPNYENGIRIVRHNSQGDTKFINDRFTWKDCEREIISLFECRSDLIMSMMPGPSFFPLHQKFNKVAKTADPNVIAQFLAEGNLFWYSLPYGYMDMGPRVVLEAMAVGLPCLVDSQSGGAVDRISNPGTDAGWALDSKQWVDVIRNIRPLDLQMRGQIAKEKAFSLRPEKWVEVLLS